MQFLPTPLPIAECRPTLHVPEARTPSLSRTSAARRDAIISAADADAAAAYVSILERVIGIELALSAAAAAVFYSGASRERDDDHPKLAIKADIKEERTTPRCKIKISAPPLFPRFKPTLPTTEGVRDRGGAAPFFGRKKPTAKIAICKRQTNCNSKIRWAEKCKLQMVSL